MIEQDAPAPAPLKYKVTPIVDGEQQDFPISREPLTADEVASSIKARLLSMEKQGYWRDNSCNQIPLTCVSYVIDVAQPEDDEAEESEEDDEMDSDN